MNRINFIDFVDKVKSEFKLFETTDTRTASIDVKNKVIYVNKLLDDKTKAYLIAHELAHYFLEYLYQIKKAYRQPTANRDQAYELICDILASVYVYSKNLLTPREILRIYVILHPSQEAWFRYIMLYNVLLLTGRYKYAQI
jgi:Zn-dependent peptidase ImmA (M78 family)